MLIRGKWGIQVPSRPCLRVPVNIMCAERLHRIRAVSPTQTQKEVSAQVQGESRFDLLVASDQSRSDSIETVGTVPAETEVAFGE